MTSSTPCGPTIFTVTEQLGLLGTLAKLPVDQREATIDFTCWLAPGEFVASLDQHGIIANPVVPEVICSDVLKGGGTWSLAFNCSCGPFPVTQPPVGGADTNPLTVLGASPINNGTQGTILIGQGTSGLTYGVSFLAVAAPSQRRKAVDLLVCVGTPMVDITVSPQPPPPLAYQFVTGDIALASGSHGSIFVNNTSGHAITITLPPLPVVNQNLVIKDITGNAATYPITIIATGYTIDGAAQLVLHANYSWAELTFTGIQWMQV